MGSVYRAVGENWAWTWRYGKLFTTTNTRASSVWKLVICELRHPNLPSVPIISVFGDHGQIS